MSKHAIPTEPQEDPSENIMAALAHGMTGNPQAGLALLKPFFETPRHMVSLCAALAESTAMFVRQQTPNAETTPWPTSTRHPQGSGSPPSSRAPG
jgi:hypothetical protein